MSDGLCEELRRCEVGQWWMKWLMVLCAGWVAMAVAMALTGCGPMTFTIGGSPEDNALRVEVIEKAEGWRNDRIAIIDVTGVIMNAHPRSLLSSGDNPVGLFREKLDAARADDRVRAVVLRLNTPGGTVTASDMMYRELQRFREQTGKPVVALMMDVAASGGYYLACGADQIVAYPTSVTGSIGVIFQTMSVKPALERWGIKPEAFVSGPNKNAGSPLSDMTDDQRVVMQSLVDDFYGRFVALVRERRPGIASSDLAMVTDGRVVSGETALRYGLVDHVGDLENAKRQALALAGMDRADVVIYRRPMTYVGSPYAATHIEVSAVQIGSGRGGGMGGVAEMPAGFYYLWVTGVE